MSNVPSNTAEDYNPTPPAYKSTDVSYPPSSKKRASAEVALNLKKTRVMELDLNVEADRPITEQKRWIDCLDAQSGEAEESFSTHPGGESKDGGGSEGNGGSGVLLTSDPSEKHQETFGCRVERPIPRHASGSARWGKDECWAATSTSHISLFADNRVVVEASTSVVSCGAGSEWQMGGGGGAQHWGGSPGEGQGFSGDRASRVLVGLDMRLSVGRQEDGDQAWLRGPAQGRRYPHFCADETGGGLEKPDSGEGMSAFQ